MPDADDRPKRVDMERAQPLPEEMELWAASETQGGDADVDEQARLAAVRRDVAEAASGGAGAASTTCSMCGASRQIIESVPPGDNVRPCPDRSQLLSEEKADTIEIQRRDSDRILWVRRLPNGPWCRLNDLVPPLPDYEGEER